MTITLKGNDFILILAAILTSVGAFSPMIDILGVSNMSYAGVAEERAYLLVACANLAVILSVTGKRRFTVLPALGAWVIFLWPFLERLVGDSDRGGLLDKVKDIGVDPLKKVTEQFFKNIFDLEWGGYMFLAGMVLLLITAVMISLNRKIL